jgi:four helix bundle protein
MKTRKKQYVGNVRDLKVYGKALQFHKTIYEIVESLPDYEQYNLCDLLRKSSSSALANLSEGNTNYYYNKEYNHLNMVLSKIGGECRSALDICRMVGYISEPVYKKTDQQAEEILKMIIGMMRRIERYLDNEQDNLDTDGVFENSTIPPIDISDVYEKATNLNVLISELVFQYPIIEEKNMKDQIVRAANSILKNLKRVKINSCSQSYLDINTALGSISETIAFCDMSLMQGYISKNQYDELNKLGKGIMDSLIELINQMVQGNEEMQDGVCG